MSSRIEFRVRAFVARLRGLLSRQMPRDEFDDEVQNHLRMLTDRFAAQGMSPENAARAARLQFGNTTILKEDRRELQSLTSVEALWLDFRYAIRTLSKSRVFAAVSIATLALGIGAATAIFSVIDNVLLAPFPYKGAQRMVFPQIQGALQSDQQGRQGYTANEVLELSGSNHVFDGTTAAKEDLVLYKHGEGTDELYGAHLTPGTFEFFGMPALHGRVLQASDYEPGAPPVFVLRYKTWKQRFNGDLSVLNKSFVLNGVARTLVGIMPLRFAWYDSDVYIPEKLMPAAGTDPAAIPNWFFVGRLKPGVSTEQAQADLQLIANHLAKIYPKEYPAQFTVQIKPLGDTVFSHFQTTLYMVLAAVGLLLLIACSNVANLMLARATVREKEIALRTALGARRARIIRMLMIESLVLAVAGAVFGILIAWGGLKALVVSMPQDLIPAETVIQLNAPVLAFTLGLAVFTPLIFGLAPALQLVRRNLNNSLRDSGKGVSGGFQGRWLRDAVVVAEVALSLTLLVGAGLLTRSFVALRNLNLGLRADHVFQTILVLPTERYKTTEQETAYFRPLLERVKALPGVVEAAQSNSLPPYGGNDGKLEVVGKTHFEDWHTLIQSVSEGYFRTLRVALKQGRTFSEEEVTDARKLAVVNETFVRKYLDSANPIGQRVRLSLDGVSDPLFEIIGVVRDVTNRGLQAPIEPELWIPHTINGSQSRVLIVRSAQDMAGMMDLIQKQVWAADPGVAMAYSYALEDFISERMYAGPRFGFAVMSVFGCVGLILVTIGVYSVLAYATARKTHEIGIRMALGAKGADVLGLIVGMGLRLVVIGILVGIALSLALGRFIGTELVGIHAYDPATLAATTLLLILTAVLACWVPARRAWRVDPVIALRYE